MLTFSIIILEPPNQWLGLLLIWKFFLQLTVFFGNNNSLLRITHLWIVAAKTFLMFMQNYITSDKEHHNCHNLYKNFSIYWSNLHFSRIKNDICMFRLHTIYWHHLALSGLPHFTNVTSCHQFTSDWCCTIWGKILSLQRHGVPENCIAVAKKWLNRILLWPKCSWPKLSQNCE